MGTAWCLLSDHIPALNKIGSVAVVSLINRTSNDSYQANSGSFNVTANHFRNAHQEVISGELLLTHLCCLIFYFDIEQFAFEGQ